MTTVFKAGRVRRWHTNPDLVDYDDRIDAHSGRVARIILRHNPNPSARLLRAALTHDDGEWMTGDIAYPAKEHMPPMVGAWLEATEARGRRMIWGDDPDLSIVEQRWLKFADRLDSYQWVQAMAPHALSGDGWPEAFAWLAREAADLGVTDYDA